VPLQDLQAAFDKYAQSQVAAFGESRRVYLEEQAAVLGLVPTWSKVAEAARGAGAEGAAAGRAIAAGITEAGRAADDAARRVAQLAEQLKISVDDAADHPQRVRGCCAGGRKRSAVCAQPAAHTGLPHFD